ncbi:hypothetical protein KXD93_12260 [Mucilaginibacter sp. BJC16-A38]|uniref:hypothetical protein n=1 Tax=Mucilaginibacter phenanthrenivorans TaxID=1234842 RepID=UPI0021587D20|nr:hypothetical protein [Mucilaginibacter phenanthrenivorans]MCR8558420.1 hypothetical protein [Mucilaginibacter phenanthrenivorans]
MKKFLSIIGCIIVMAAASSCTKKYITPNPNETLFATINPSDWVLSTDGKSYSAQIDVKELDPNFNHYGGVLVSIYYPTTNPSDEVYEQLPEVFAGTSFSYTYNAGSVAIYAQSPDGATAIKPTDVIKAKIILVASN